MLETAFQAYVDSGPVSNFITDLETNLQVTHRPYWLHHTLLVPVAKAWSRFVHQAGDILPGTASVLYVRAYMSPHASWGCGLLS